eukprot:763737-Hanusia_phi.AAC.1
MVVNAWCYSHRYGFAEKLDVRTGKVCEEKHQEELSIPGITVFNDDDVERTLEGFLETKCASLDPELIPQTEGMSSHEVSEKFLRNGSKRVLLLKGIAGAGKSTLCKKWALELWKKWKELDHIPLFLHLPRHTRVKEYLKEQRIDLEKHWTKFMTVRRFLLILDSFDEKGRKENVVKVVCEEFRECQDYKIVIACRSDYGGSEALFVPPVVQTNALQTFWVCPLDLSNNALVDRYIDHHVSYHQDQWDREALNRIPELDQVIKTPFLLKVTLSVLPEISRDGNLIRHDLYKEYTKQWSDREWNKVQNVQVIMQKLNALGLDDENYRAYYMQVSHIFSESNVPRE